MMTDNNAITHIIPRFKGVNAIVTGCLDGALTFEQAFIVAQFYYDYQDTNQLIEEAEAMAVENAGALKETVLSLEAETSTLINNIGKLDGVDFKTVANAHTKQYYTIFQDASEELNPYWKRYCELNNRLDYLPLGSKEYAETEKECVAAKAEHDARQAEVRRLYAEYETESRRAGDVFTFKPSHLLALAMKLNGIAGSIIADLDRMEKGNGQ